ncbi:helix-turn-helix domain-containing protein [Pontivivens insulae]|uniref:Cytoskeleton protein RodZ n=1 Tax=Pontivivens insulae TaxID=1639689 RepID=A0A2R8AB09_9RHOB|nr:helix-turn-helix transcriptional regulator [Pontivivens insulae]RED13314.1 helix-turn-helix protein [Pontivivens insulae]SPF29406.1 Cytoskeleton protein RodZ [Pontivivens insulae]
MRDQEPTDMQDYFHDDAATFGDRMAAAREAIGLDQSRLAKRLGLRVDTIRNWEDDRAEPRANRIQMLAGVLGVSITWLLSGQGDGITVGADNDGDLATILAEVRAIRIEQTRLAERSGQLEKKLRSMVL